MAAMPAITARSPVVYVVQDDRRKNFTGCLEFGSVECLLEEDQELGLLNARKIIDTLRFKLQKMEPGDFIVPTGNPVSIGIAFAIAAEVTGGQFKALKWDGQENRYFAVNVDLTTQPYRGQ